MLGLYKYKLLNINYLIINLILAVKSINISVLCYIGINELMCYMQQMCRHCMTTKQSHLSVDICMNICSGMNLLNA